MKLSRQLPLDQLEPPETDVRQGRPEEAVKSLASSMGDPSVGQLQPILVHPTDHEDLPDDPDEDEFRSYVQECDSFRIVDGLTRFQAAEMLGWHDLWAWVWPHPPENTVIAQLDANTEGLEMSEFETVRAILDHKEETGKTWQEVGNEVGYSPGYLSQIANAMDAPEHIYDAWRDPDVPVETGHVLDLMKVDREDIRDLLFRQHLEHEYTVGQLRDRIERKLREVQKEEADGRTVQEKQHDGQAAAAEAEAAQGLDDGTPDNACTICGDEAVTMVAVPACEQDYGLLQEAKASGDPLMGNASSAASQPESPAPESNGAVDLVSELSQEFGLREEDAARVLDELAQQAAQAPQEATDD